MKKLVRDKIPKIIESNGDKCKYYIADKEEYINSLLDKIIEESNEVIESKNDIELKEEIADLLEVIFALNKAKGFNIEEIENIRLEKKEKRGGFDDKIILTNY